MDGTSTMPAPVAPATEESKGADLADIMESKDPSQLMNQAL